MVVFEKGSYVFLPDEDECYVPAQVTSSFEQGKPGAVTLVDGGRQVRVMAAHSARTQAMDKQSLRCWPDMVVLKQLDNASLLHNIRMRYAKDDIFTSIGSILISVNPYKTLDIFGPDTVDRFMEAGAALKDMPPHIYGIAESAYSTMVNEDCDTSCVITGESGAGKTEATKLFMAYVAERSRRSRRGRGLSFEQMAQASDSAFDVPLREQILGANPVMEAFGNAKTVRNNNSSRFGKLIDVQFLRSLGCVAGGEITNYLLEKSRVVRHLEGERSYHVFYQLCAAAQSTAPHLKKLRLEAADQYFYLNQSEKPSTVIDDVDDASSWDETMEAMKLLRMTDAQLEGVAQVLAAILHLGNVEFEPVSPKSDFARVKNAAPLEMAAQLFGVQPEEMERGLLTRDISNRAERVIQKHNVREATDSRDALAKHTYSRLFNWLTGCINAALASRLDAVNANDLRVCSVLDIFGFESFGTNSFEQLCINYCNEKLQGFFNDHIFKLEQAEYRKEEIDVTQIGFSDNAAVIAAIDHRAEGVFAICDDQVNLLRGTDDGFLARVLDQARRMGVAVAARAAAPPQQQQQQLQDGDDGDDADAEPSSSTGRARRKSSFNVAAAASRKMSKNMAMLMRSGSLGAGALDGDVPLSAKQILKEPNVKELRKNPAARTAFIVVHFAGEVMYNVEGFLEKNRDVLREDLLSVVLDSKEQLVRALFETEDMPAATVSAARGRGGRSVAALARKTLGRKFQDQLDTLMMRLNATEPHFVRTIKPNSVKRPSVFEAPLVLDQLRYAGLLEVCRIRQMGYPIRKDFDEFFHLYRCIRPDAADAHDLVEKLRADGLLFGNEWQKGRTKVFMRAVQFDKLTGERERALWAVTVLVQTAMRRFLARSKYVRTRTAFRDLEQAIARRDRATLERVIPFAASLPNAGRNVSLLERARRVLAEIKQEEKHLAALDLAVEARDVDALQSLLATAEEMGLGDRPEVARARALLAQHGQEKRVMKDLRAAIDARDVALLSDALERAEALDMSKCHEAQTARALLARLEEEEKLIVELEAALRAKNVPEMERLAQALTDLGAGDHPTVLAAQRLTKKIAQESAARKKALEKLHRDAEAAIQNRDLEQLKALRVRIAELGAKGAIFDEAMRLREQLEVRETLLHKVAVEMGLLSAKARSLDGLVAADAEPLAEALEQAEAEGLTPETEPELRAASAFLARMQRQIAVQEQLEDALAENTYAALLAALMAAQALGMETENARRVAEEVRHLEKIRMALDRIDNRRMRERRASLLRFATAEERNELDAERMAATDSDAFDELRAEAEADGDRYALHNFYRIRADEDFVESFPPAERNRQADMKLWSSRTQIPKSLTELDEDQDVIAVRVNHAVLQYCGDVGAANTAGLAQFVVTRGLEDPRVADEVLVQIVKHLRGNVLPNSEHNAWLLLCAATKYFGPSQQLAPYFVHFLQEHRSRPSLIGNFARLCLAQTGPSMELGPCRFKPSADELAHYKLRPPVLLSISVVDGSVVTLPCSPDQRVEHMHKLVRAKTGILDAVSRPAFALFVKDTNQTLSDDLRERLVKFFKFYNTEKLAHVETFVAYWRGREEELFEKLQDKYGPEPAVLAERAAAAKAAAGAEAASGGLRLPITAARAATKLMRVNHVAPKHTGPAPQAAWPIPFWVYPGAVYKNLAKQSREPQFSFKRRFVPDKGAADTLLFRQVLMDVESGLLTITSEQDVAELAAIALVLDDGDAGGAGGGVCCDAPLDDPAEIMEMGLKAHIPRSWLDSKPAEHFARIVASQVDLGSAGPQALRQRYVDIASNAPAFGMSVYYATREDRGSDRLYCVGVDQHGVHILSPQRDNVVCTFPIKSIKKFGATAGTFWMKVKKSALKQGGAAPGGAGARLSRRFGGAKPKEIRNETAGAGGAGSKFSFLNRNDGFDVVLNTLQAWELYDIIFDLRKVQAGKDQGAAKRPAEPTPLRVQ